MSSFWKKPSLKPAELLHVKERMLRRFGRHYRAGEMVFREGDQGQSVYFILTGRVCIEKTNDEVRKVLTSLEAGKYFGEMAAFIASPRTASARALEDSYIAVIDRETFLELLRSSGDVSLLILKEFAGRLKTTSDELNRTTESARRLKTVVFLCQRDGGPGGEEVTRDLAALLGDEPEEAAALLAWFHQQGAIVFEQGKVVRVNREVLMSLALEL
jgi:CRP/FNR family transcriptional regulator